jgi:hypothetical protein
MDIQLIKFTNMWPYYDGPCRTLKETDATCPFWIRGPVHRMLTVVYGCGGYGEVSSDHPAYNHDMYNKLVEPTQITAEEEAYICKRCHGTGIITGEKYAS